MAELTQQERLQPALLDRLTDEEPGKTQESRERRVLSVGRLRASVLRDLSWLLNTGNLASTVDLSDAPLVQRSVLNYGMPDLAGLTASNTNPAELERLLRQAIWDFEPRILRDSVKVRAVLSEDQMNVNALAFEIEGEMWAQPLPLHLYLKTEIDLEEGSIRVADYDGRGSE